MSSAWGGASRVRASRKARVAMAYAGGPFGPFTATDGLRTILINEVTGSADCLAVHLSGPRESERVSTIEEFPRDWKMTASTIGVRMLLHHKGST